MNQLKVVQHPVSKLVFTEGNEVVTNSSIVSEVFNKRHADVLKSIETLSCTKEFSERNFSLAEYKDAQGKPRPKYLLRRDGLMFLVMGYTGEKAAFAVNSYCNIRQKDFDEALSYINAWRPRLV
ncbi:Rha family transcriptional regulator [Bacillus mycoides]|uniref:Rha family transcriptional regulator n=1 Tax=Bacillus mycoides TaxID=1405 RepID=UPI0011A66C83|nr:Rha family transcriptional regulator [Bacillus mycoides]